MRKNIYNDSPRVDKKGKFWLDRQRSVWSGYPGSREQRQSFVGKRDDIKFFLRKFTSASGTVCLSIY